MNYDATQRQIGAQAVAMQPSFALHYQALPAQFALHD